MGAIVKTASNSYEFEALKWARNYRKGIIREFSAYLRGDVIEVGAGIGQMTELLARVPGVNHLLSVEPDPLLIQEFHQRLPGHHLVEGTVADVTPESPCNCIVSVNVLEHINEDQRELRSYAALLRKTKGTICLLVPARPEIYAPLDDDFGHHRRYARPDLRAKITAAGFECLRLHYFNFIGYFAWWFSFCVLRKRRFDISSVRFFDRMVFPMTHSLESMLLRPPVGQSLVAIARVSE